MSGPPRAAAGAGRGAGRGAPPDAGGAAAPGARRADGATFRTRRLLPHPPERVFEAFARPELLARWWGPDGFTSTFERFEFAPGGRWTFVMHGPGGSRHPNECVVVAAERPSARVVRHASKPRYLLTVGLAAHAGGTVVSWEQEFDDAAVAARLRHVAEPANEQTLDRLGLLLSGAAPR